MTITYSIHLILNIAAKIVHAMVRLKSKYLREDRRLDMQRLFSVSKYNFYGLERQKQKVFKNDQ